jgi:hypothetical protein
VWNLPLALAHRAQRLGEIPPHSLRHLPKCHRLPRLQVSGRHSRCPRPPRQQEHFPSFLWLPRLAHRHHVPKILLLLRSALFSQWPEVPDSSHPQNRLSRQFRRPAKPSFLQPGMRQCSHPSVRQNPVLLSQTWLSHSLHPPKFLWREASAVNNYSASQLCRK